MTDQELLSAYVHSRDVDSLGAFVRRYQEGLLRFASRFLSDDLTAQDVVQETFLRVARHPRRLLDVESCHNWLIRVARNICLDHIRKAVRGRKAMARLAESAREAAPAEAEAATALSREETRAQVFQAIGTLRPRYREVVLLKVQEGKSYREIAAITGLSATNVGYILHHAMKALAQKLAGLEL
jgi:RNA polymerase sigma-70 factor (ECF subfamily)